jgi:hypothetical protein
MKKQYKFLEKENWFKHDFRSREDKKLIRLKMKWKSSAPIGIFWQLCEMVYESSGLLEYDIDVIAYNCGDSVELVEDVIKMCFIITDDNFLTHETIVEQLDVREAGFIITVSNKSKAGKASAEAKRLAKELEQQSNNSSTGVQQVFNTTQHTINTTQPEKRVESKEIRVESREKIDKKRLATVYTAAEQPELIYTIEDNLNTEVVYTEQMIKDTTTKFAEHITDRFKLNHFLIEVKEDWGGWDSWLDICFGDDTSVKNNYNNRLNQYRNGIYA